MTPETQTILALAVVLVTFCIFIFRVFKRRKKPGCGGGCGCPRK